MDTIRSIPTLLPGNNQCRVDNCSTIDKIPVVPIAAALLALSYLFILYFQCPQSIKAPLLGADLSEKEREKKYQIDATSLLSEGYQKFKDGIYRLTTVDGSESVVLSHKYLDELKSLPDDALSFISAINLVMAGKYSTIGESRNDLSIHVIKSDLTPSLGRLQPIIAEEIDIALKRVLPPCDDWIPVKIHQKLLDIVAEVSARIFVGESLCRNPRWIELSRDYTTLAFSGARAIKQWKPWLRPFVYRFIPELRKLYKVRQEAVEFMMPITKERAETETKKDDMTQWMKEKSSASWAKDYEGQAKLQVQLAMAAIHTTTMATTQVLYDLVARPEYIPLLREELTTVLAETDGHFEKDTLTKLKKLDSFMKESQRTNPPGYTTFKRRVMRDLTLSDGTFLPAGTLIEIDSLSRTTDPNLVEEPDRFDGLRYYDMRQRSEKETHMHQFSSSSSAYLAWGAGRHACPGRFFAAAEVKTVVAKVLLGWDVRLADGVEGGRPGNLSFGTQVIPHPTAEVLFKKRAAS